MFLPQLRTVVWKNGTIRKRHGMLTIVELLLPITLFLLIAYGRSEITGLNKVFVTEITYNPPQIIQYSDLDVSETKLYFTPDTGFYQDLMRRVQIKFQMYNNNIKGFPSSKSLLEYYTLHHNDSTVVAVIFKEGDQNNLNYVVRVHQDYYSTDINTAELYRNSFNFEPGTGTSYYYKGYLSIQKAVDMAYIEQMSGKDLETDVSLMIQEFPYPPHKQDSALTTMFLTYLPLITLFSFIFISPAVLKRVVEEKHSGIKELLKMVGMKSWMLWLGWFMYGMAPMVFSILCIVVLMKVPFFGTDYPPIEHTDGSILFAFLLLYCMAATIFCFAVSSLFRKPMVAVLAGVLVWILSYFVPKYGLDLNEMGTKLSWNSALALNLLPNMALHYGYAAISGYEQRDVGLHWDNFYESSSGGTDDVTMLHVFIMLVVDMIVYMTFTFYMDGVNPGKYGIRKPYSYPFRALCRVMKRRRAVPDTLPDTSHDLEVVEKGEGFEKGIEIQGLVKLYKNNLVVDDLSLDIYKNQITVLLGPNGAGKSTTMSIITGMIEMTSGSIAINGIDIKDDMDEIRKSLGLCPQHNLLFTDLTVGEHLMFFAKLKGKTATEAEIEMIQLLKKLKLSDKKNDLACTLSGGMKRKLCLGMAVIGGSKVLILDEPSSGMDPQSRRELWDLLLEWRREKTILITTHFMEEADVLGDWIAIMANGSLQCYGTPMGLKKKYKTGYHLSLMVRNGVTEGCKSNIVSYIKNRMNTAEFRDCNGNNMVFVLPLEDNREIGRLLTCIEYDREYLQIENISITVTTLEDIFLKVKMESEENCRFQRQDSRRSGDEQFLKLISKDTFKIAEGWEKLKTRLCALSAKRLKFFAKKFFFYFMPVIIGIAFLGLTVYLSRNVVGNNGDNGPEVKFQLDIYKHTTVFYNGTLESDVGGRLKNYFNSTIETNRGKAMDVADVQQEIVDKGIENIVYYKTHLVVGAEFNIEEHVQATALYNAGAIHSAPISLNMITNSLAKTYLGSNYSITASNWPLKTVNSNVTQEYSKDKVRLLWTVIVPIGFLFVIGSFIVFPHIESSTNFVHLQSMCGMKICWYWFVNFLMDLTLYLIFAGIVGGIAVCAAPYIEFYELTHLIAIFVLYGMANIPFVYLFSRMKSVSGGFATFMIMGIFFGIVSTVLVQGLMELENDFYTPLGRQLKRVFVFFLPQVGLTHSMMVLIGKAIENYNWDAMPRMKYTTVCMQQLNPCCDGETAECAAYKSYRLGENFFLMFVSCVMYLTINIFLDLYFVKKILFVVRKIFWRPKTDENEVENYDYESRNNSIWEAEPLQENKSSEQTDKSIEFTVNKKECLGILGVNGAGKTTTIRRLAREDVFFDNNLTISRYDDENKTKTEITMNEFTENLGYCPQNDALNFILTGREILTLIAQLHGFTDMQIVEEFLILFELGADADKPCGHYSGGNKRKLSLAIALMGFKKYIMLDEPTNGVDPSTCRKFWTLIRNCKEKDLSFILTSHSMVECEALCNRLKFMKNRQFKAEGTISELKERHGGFNIKLKLHCKDSKATKDPRKEECYDKVDSIDAVSEDIEMLKTHFVETYNGRVKDEHLGGLHIYVKNGKISWSEMFQELEGIQDRYQHLIEDYTISEATLEDVFLKVARSGKPEKKKKKEEDKSDNKLSKKTLSNSELRQTWAPSDRVRVPTLSRHKQDIPTFTYEMGPLKKSPEQRGPGELQMKTAFPYRWPSNKLHAKPWKY